MVLLGDEEAVPTSFLPEYRSDDKLRLDKNYLKEYRSIQQPLSEAIWELYSIAPQETKLAFAGYGAGGGLATIAAIDQGKRTNALYTFGAPPVCGDGGYNQLSLWADLQRWVVEGDEMVSSWMKMVWLLVLKKVTTMTSKEPRL